MDTNFLNFKFSNIRCIDRRVWSVLVTCIFFCYSLTFKHESQNLDIFVSWLIRILCAHMNRKSKALCPFRVAVDAIKCFTEISYFFNLSRAQGIMINYLINESGRFTDRILWLLVTKSFLNIQYCSNIMFLVVDFSPDLLKKYSTKNTYNQGNCP